MFTLLDFTDQALAEYLNSALRRHGLDSHVFNVGVDPQLRPMYSIACLNASELQHARHLIYSSRAMLLDLPPEVAEVLREARRQNRQGVMALLTSRAAIIFSLVALTVAALGYLFDR